ncbi:MAG: hypothetical protein Q3960_02765 [Lactobacillus sp.]|nr:hypothetical protein [Lactobacillus sp.]
MKELKTIKLADDLAQNQAAFLAGKQTFDATPVFEAIDELEVLDKPIAEYFEMKVEEYDQTESDHKLTLLDLSQKLADVKDRVLVNHVDGFVDKHEINFTYNHENPWASDQYNKEVDYHVVTYALKVISAVLAIAKSDLQEVISKDAVLSIGLAARALSQDN